MSIFRCIYAPVSKKSLKKALHLIRLRQFLFPQKYHICATSAQAAIQFLYFLMQFLLSRQIKAKKATKW